MISLRSNDKYRYLPLNRNTFPRESHGEFASSTQDFPDSDNYDRVDRYSQTRSPQQMFLNKLFSQCAKLVFMVQNNVPFSVEIKPPSLWPAKLPADRTHSNIRCGVLFCVHGAGIYITQLGYIQLGDPAFSFFLLHTLPLEEADVYSMLVCCVP